MAKSTDPLDFQITLAAWRRIPRLRARVQQAARVTFEHLPARLQFPARAAVLLAGNAKIRTLNREFRGSDKPTNVLSFPQFSPGEFGDLREQKEPVELGDIALAYQYVVAEAKNDHKILINHITHLVIHGLLHLFGYDHMQDRDAARMEKLEIRILHALGLPDPYLPVMNPKQMNSGKKTRK